MSTPTDSEMAALGTQRQKKPIWDPTITLGNVFSAGMAAVALGGFLMAYSSDQAKRDSRIETLDKSTTEERLRTKEKFAEVVMKVDKTQEAVQSVANNVQEVKSKVEVIQALQQLQQAQATMKGKP